MRLNTLLPLLLFGTAAIALQAHTRGGLSIQGTLKNGDNGAVADRQYNMTFCIYTTSSIGDAVWTDAQSNASIRGGRLQRTARHHDANNEYVHRKSLPGYYSGHKNQTRNPPPTDLLLIRTVCVQTGQRCAGDFVAS